ncbi:MAG TPA: 1-(5-phosphoribosyl)-5-[(5-phosphoribosylamino)methylideneamino] imidazole-4-carboxamide isomerase [Acidimicrobiia bacterium]|nr:1-(5-phosphoribosyl)-5-[(5-phosphoribosylamino)methylideneamino] imidazole-4-carboxamide isomerase [Acidimicrobiia bacterium]
MTSPSSNLEVIPAVDVLDGRVVRLLRGDYARVTEYGSDPVEAARSWVGQGASRVHVVDLDGARHGAPNLALWEGLGRAGIPFQAGGGIRTAVVARQVLEAGAERVVMGTAAVAEPEMLAGLGEAVVAAVDVRDGKARGSGWLDRGRPLIDVLDGLAAAAVPRVMVTGIGRDGTLGGADLDLTREVADDGRFAVVASGGVGTLSDLDPIAAAGCEAVVVGRALYDHRFTLAEAIAHLA